MSRHAATAKRETTDRIDYGPLEHWIGFHLRMAQFSAFQAFTRRTRDLELSPGRFSALTVIGHNPGISQTQLSQSIGSDKSTLTPAIEELVRRNLVRRTRTPADKRTYRLMLTAQGEKVLRELTARAVAHERDLDAIVGVRDRPQFLRALRRITSGLG